MGRRQANYIIDEEAVNQVPGLSTEITRRGVEFDDEAFLAPSEGGSEYLIGVHVGAGSAYITGIEDRGAQPMNFIMLFLPWFTDLVFGHPAR